MDDVESADDSLRYRAFERGAARFARGEGMYHGDGCIHFACTTGGATQHGQLWKYVPASPELEGGGGNNEHGGHLELFIEPNDATVLEHADNITVAPWGDLIVCEDGLEDQFLLGVTPEGEVYTLAHNLMNHSEFAGATFSPDGTTLFVNIQNPGLTLAITGPWAQHRA
jgi:secreted PhoX family phosphatase